MLDVDLLPEKMRACMAGKRTDSPTSSSVLSSLGSKVTKSRLAIVSVVTEDHIEPVAAQILENYALLHGYEFKLEVINISDWNETPIDNRTLHFFSARWRVVQKYVDSKQYEWVLAADLDNLVVNPSRSLDEYLNIKEEIVFHIRENHEIAAGAVLLKSTLFASCFLDYWISLGWRWPETAMNSDNGDLHQIIMEIADPVLEEKCRPLRSGANKRNWDMYPGFIRCFQDVNEKLERLHHHLPIRVFFPLQGFWRTLRGNHKSFNERRDMLSDVSSLTSYQKHRNMSTLLIKKAYYTCAYPRDILVHNKRDFRCEWERDVNGNIPQIRLLDGCMYLNEKDALQLAKECCFNDYPGCIDSDGRNMCYEQDHCLQIPAYQRWNPECDDPAGVD